jgi:protein gp37
MGMKTSIAWCDHTFNPWIGCAKVSPGCANCYAEAWAKRSGLVEWGGPRRRTGAAKWREPKAWNNSRIKWEEFATGHQFKLGPRPRVFCGSLMDWLDPEVPAEWLADLLGLIHATPNLDWLLLTKRPGLWRDRMSKLGEVIESIGLNWVDRWLDGTPPPNVWIGCTVEDQQRADERIPELLKIPARVRFLSCEPLLGPINFRAMPLDPGNPAFLYWPLTGEHVADGYNEPRTFANAQRIHWVIVGGESGPNYRPMDLVWMGGIIDQCKAAGVPVFVKQDSGPRPGTQGRIPDELWQLKEFPEVEAL